MDTAACARSHEELVAAVELRTGLSLGGARRPGATAGLARAMAAAGVEDHGAYRRLLERDPAAFDALVEELTVGETYFLRERPQLEVLRRHILADLVDRRGPGDRLELWSAGCASGEEAYTLAMILDEMGLGRRSRVLGTDLSTTALRRAEAGVYGAWSLRAVRPSERDAWLEPVGRQFRVRDRLARRVRFQAHNLLEGPPAGAPPFDVVFCRNVLIYLVPAALDGVVRTLVASLAPGGWLVTASCDPHLDRVDGLERVRTPHGIAYQRPDPAAGARHATVSRIRPVAPTGTATERADRAVPASPAPALAAAPAPAASPDDRARAARSAFSAADYPTAAALALDAAAEGAGPEAYATALRSLANAGRRSEALAWSRAAVAAYPLDAELRYLQAVLEAESGHPDDAAAAAAAALYLQPDLAIAHVLRAQATRALGEDAEAERCLRNARRLLATVAADEPVALADGEPAGRLLAWVDAQMAGHDRGGRRR